MNWHRSPVFWTAVGSVGTVLATLVALLVYLSDRPADHGVAGPGSSPTTSAAPLPSGSDPVTSVPSTTSPGDPPTSSPGAVPAGHAPRRSDTTTPVTVSGGYSIDLDSLATNWDVTSGGLPGRDLWYVPSVNAVWTTTDIVAVDPSAEWEDCENTTQRLGRVILGSAKVHGGAAYCFKTTDQRWARISFTEVAPGDHVTFDVLVWN